LFMGFCCCLFWLLCVYFTRGKSLVIDKSMVVKKKNVVKSILTSYLSLVKLKAMRILMIYKAAFTCAFSLYNVGTIYYLQYSLGLGNTYSSYMYAFQIIIFAITTPLINKMALKMGKAQQQMTALFAGGIVGVAIFILMPNSVVGSVIYIALFSVVQNGFWQVSTSIFYDVVEVDEYVNYKRREGDIMSLVSVFGTIITAIMVQVFGILLDFAGFNPDLAVQPGSAQWLIGAMYVLVPSICFLIGALALKVFPVNKKTFASLLEVLKLRREGKDYSQYMEDMKKITE
ncbi:MAG: MFS transporter, partial [Firmicutes bacterium]|nr:MFS transporter [Bacillota bacterium]